MSTAILYMCSGSATLHGRVHENMHTHPANTHAPHPHACSPTRTERPRRLQNDGWCIAETQAEK